MGSDGDQKDRPPNAVTLGLKSTFPLAGKEVFEGETIAELCRKHLDETPVPPGRRVGRNFNPELEALLMRCLEKDPSARLQSAQEVAERLAASRSSEQWTKEHRAAWWADYRQAASGIVKPAIQFAASEIEKTVRIEFADRSP